MAKVLYVSGYYSTAAACQISQQENIAVEFHYGWIHVFRSKRASMFKYTLARSRVPRKIHSSFLLVLGKDHLLTFVINQPCIDLHDQSATLFQDPSCGVRRNGMFPPTCRRISQRW